MIDKSYTDVYNNEGHDKINHKNVFKKMRN